MANVNEEPTTAPVVQESKGSRGCLYGCLFVIIGGVLLIVCGGIGAYWFITGQVEKYTSTEPVKLPMVEYTPEQLAELEARVDAFTTAVEEGGTPDSDLVLTAEEINALISKDENIRGKVYVTIEDGQVSGDISIPTDAIPGGKGRYFNGSASFAVSMDEGILIVTLTDAKVNGEPVPQQFVDGMAQQNLARDLYNDAETAKTLRKFESVEIKDDTIVLKVRRGQDSEATDDSATDPVEEATSTESEATESEATESDATESDTAPSENALELEEPVTAEPATP